MKKAIYLLFLPLVVISGLVFANRELKTDTSKTPIPKQVATPVKKGEVNKWEDTPEGIKFKQWETSLAGENVLAGISRISRQVNSFTNMEAVVTSVFLPPGSRLGFGVMVAIAGVDYILKFDAEQSQLEQLHTLKVNDKIIIKSHNVSLAPKYAYPIITGDYVERDNKIIYKSIPRQDGC